MVLLLWLIKPLLYAVTFVLGARFFAASGTSPLSGRSLRLVVGLATVARLLLGVPGGLLAGGVLALGSRGGFAVLIYGLGFASWLLTAKVAFRPIPLARLAVFAAIAEAVSGTIDVLAWHDLGPINFC